LVGSIAFILGIGDGNHLQDVAYSIEDIWRVI
jgi:hypothetical protein